MIPSTTFKRILAACAGIGLSAVLTGIALGVVIGPSFAGAAPVQVPEGTLGVGEVVVAPIDRIPSGEGKIAMAATHVAASGLLTPSTLAAAPLPARTTTRAKSPSRSTTAASVNGWKSARVSWYGPGFYGRKTASGAVLVEGMMNCAHRSLPFGTRIQFEYKGRTCVAVVNDRGPFVGGRTFDLGPGTATALGFSGVGTVKYRILGR